MLMDEESLDVLPEGLELSEADEAYAQAICDGVKENFEALTEEIELLAIGYDLNRIYKVDLAILLVAAYEIKNAEALNRTVAQDTLINKAIACNEAVELAKRYSTIKSPAFVNGILAKIN